KHKPTGHARPGDTESPLTLRQSPVVILALADNLAASPAGVRPVTAEIPGASGQDGACARAARALLRRTPVIPPYRSALALFAIFAVFACSKAYIPNTDVEDTSVNRKVVAYCEQYRHAMEDKDVGQLLKAMSPGYFDDRANISTDYDQVRDFLTGDFLKTSAIRYEIRYRRVTFTETNHVYVDYTFAAAWKLPGVKVDEWHHKVADNR